jgi:hypothetical protein
MAGNDRRLLAGKQEILKYLGIGHQAFQDFIKMGLPAQVFQNKWYAHVDNIDDFFKHMTKRGAREFPEDAE